MVGTTQHSLPQLIEIGVAGRPHGIRGEFRVFLHNADSELLKDSDEVFIERPEDDAPLQWSIAAVRPGPKHLVVSLKTVHSREDAERFKGARVLVPRNDLPDIGDDEFYVADLIGKEVWQGEVQLGIVASSRPQGGIEVVLVHGDGVEFEIPLVDVYVEKLDMAARRLWVVDVDELPRTPLSPRGK